MPTLALDALQINYALHGTGDGTPLLCLHGGGCDGGDYAPLAARLGGARRLVCPDLRGHGASGAPEGPYDPGTLAEDVLALARHLGLGKVVLVGHSLGGAVTERLLAAGALEVAAVVSLDAPTPLAAGMKQGLGILRDAFKGPDPMATYRPFMAQVVGWADDPATVKRKVDALCAPPAHVLGPMLTAMADFDGGDTYGASRAPLLHIDAQQGVCDLARLTQLRPDAWIGQVVGTGHYPHLESPDQVVAMIDHFLTRHRL
ncbi:MAG: alpha/beta fold hydrolase [Deltaproteobacteria bacterium]|nr:alpha/beta fold hydrolase [Deltaproteobacteria bacterium]